MFRSVRKWLLLHITAQIWWVICTSAENSGAQTLAPAATLATRESAPHLITERQLIKVPQGAPLRSPPAIAAIAATEIQRTLTLLVVVEPDPGRTVQVLRPCRAAPGTGGGLHRSRASLFG
jgi:hypothetical protein